MPTWSRACQEGSLGSSHGLQLIPGALGLAAPRSCGHWPGTQPALPTEETALFVSVLFNCHFFFFNCYPPSLVFLPFSVRIRGTQKLHLPFTWVTIREGGTLSDHVCERCCKCMSMSIASWGFHDKRCMGSIWEMKL